MNGAWITLASLAALLGIGKIRGSRVKDDLLDIDTRGWTKFSASELYRVMVAGGDVLGNVPFHLAVQYDPRRIDALIFQELDRAFSRMFETPPEMDEVRRAIHAELMKAFSEAGEEGTRMLVENAIRSIDETLGGISQDREASHRFVANVAAIIAAFSRAQAHARRAAGIAKSRDLTSQWRAWSDLDSYFNRRIEWLATLTPRVAAGGMEN